MAPDVRPWQIRLTLLAAVTIAVSDVRAQPAPPPVVVPTPDSAEHEAALDMDDVNLGERDADSTQVAELIADLGDIQFDRRERASRALMTLCPGAFRQLARAYREIDDYETRLRIQEIVRDRFLWHTLQKHKGFLGVAYPQNGFATLPDGSLAVPLNYVNPNSAADEAGLRAGDHIRAIDGQRFTDDKSDAFRNLIQNKGAGGKAVLEVVRGRQTLMIEVTLRARPLDQYIGPELLDELNHRMQEYTIWWNQYFSLPAPRTERSPSTTVLELPD